MFAWQSLQEKQCCSDLVSARVCAPNSGEALMAGCVAQAAGAPSRLRALWGVRCTAPLSACRGDSVLRAGLAAKPFPVSLSQQLSLLHDLPFLEISGFFS